MNSDLYDYQIDKLIHHKERITPARKLILEIFCSSKKHLTSADILEEVQRREKGVSRASVFRTLDLFLKLSIVHPSFSLGGTTKFVLTEPHGHHAHLICPSCLKTTELEDCFVHDLAGKVESKYHRIVSGHLLEIYSYCEHCRKE